MLADSDTRWKWGALTARRLMPDAHLDGLLLRGRATPTPRQLAEVGVTVESLREVTTRQFLRAATAPGAYDVLVLACVGGAVQAMLHGLRQAVTATGPTRATGVTGGTGVTGEESQTSGSARIGTRDACVRRPVIVTGYVGVVYEKLTDGLLLRHGADLVLANSAYDADRFRAVYEGVGADASGVVECALPFLADRAGPGGAGGRGDAVAPAPPAAGSSGSGCGPFTVVFAAQPSVPASHADRAYLLRRAVTHARRHPEREVLIKLRSRPGEHTTHIEELPYQKLARKVPGGDGPRSGLPPNCRLVYGNMGELLDRVRRTGGMLVTVSSTAALESLHRSVPTAVLTDLGIREALGNHYFTGSHCLASWDQLDDGLLPRVDEQWARSQGILGGDRYAPARRRVAALTGLARQRGLAPPAPFYTPRTAPGYLPGILRRYGLAPDGTPLGGPLTGADDAADGAGDHPEAATLGAAGRGLVRRAVREAARGAYRHGVQRVAPLIRKAGEL